MNENSNKFLQAIGFVVEFAHVSRPFLDGEHLKLGATLKHLIPPQ